MDKKREEAWTKARFIRAGFAPLKSKATDSSIIEGQDLIDQQKILGDTIQLRHDTGFYYQYPFMLNSDSALYKRMNEPCSGYSCINSQTNYYGSQFADMNNIHFQENHYGFRPVHLDSLKRGDIIQGRKWWETGFEGERPAHAVLFDSYDKNGDLNVWDQHGSYGLINPNLGKVLYKSPD